MSVQEMRDNHDEAVRAELPQDLDVLTKFDILKAAGYTNNASKRILEIDECP